MLSVNSAEGTKNLDLIACYTSQDEILRSLRSLRMTCLGRFWIFAKAASFLARVRRRPAPSDLTDFCFQKGKQIRQVGKAPVLAGVRAFEGCPPDQFTPAPYLPQAQQVRYITSLLSAHVTCPLLCSACLRFLGVTFK